MTKRIVTTTSVFPPGYPAEKAMDRLIALGYEALDMALDYCTQPDSPFLSDRYLHWAEELRSRASAAGVPYTHAHAPGDAAGDPSLIARSIETTGALGARYLVLHPIWRRADGTMIEDEAEFIERNAEAIRPWLGMAGECGVRLLSENLLWSASADPRIISRLVKAVDSDSFGWCFDTGHANCFGYQPQVLLECAVPPLSLHLQDNCGDADSHMIPGDGTIDWSAMTRALRAAGYSGDCVLEAHHQSLDAPDEERDAILRRLLERARALRADM